jgi:thiosulfate/3-mercaptopyruvate sulfurtransferase
MQARVRVLMTSPNWRRCWPAAPLLLEAGYGARAQFEQAHIPGARYLDTSNLEHAPHWLKVPDDELLAVLLAHGIRHDSVVILYGRNNLAAARAAHLMLYAGVRDAPARWRLSGMGRAGRPASGSAPEATAAGDFGAAFPGSRPTSSTTRRRAHCWRRGTASSPASARIEHLGLISGYSYIAARGDIPARAGRVPATMATSIA